MSLPDDASSLRARADHQAIDDAETISPHTAFAAIRPELWLALHRLGFAGGKVIVQGDGADALLNRPGADVPGTSSISATVGHPKQRHLVDPNETFRGGLDAYDAAVTVMPMADIELNTPAAIVQRTLIHAALTWATLRMVRPGGLAAVITNHMTLDGNTPRSREEIAVLGDLLGAVRLPSGALRPQMPGTDAVTDILLFSRRPQGQPSRSRDFIDTYAVPIQGRYIRLNTYFDTHPEHVLGLSGAIHRVAGGPILTVTGRPGRMASELHQTLGHIASTAQHDGLVQPPAETPPGMGVLAIHKESKVPHATAQLATRAVRAAAQNQRMRRGPGVNGLSMN
ncbi:hypothetical protein Xcel_0796 [Xylanimonas cellulosilytica DSM 15894]|uniref:Uncharacterized protein n=1 Tax=Xylanimonas cellulosilytica (strain DSM 15894 / JCM 12276 / CECT 5975 / KCTC 9989 / LMG 20990 / NBRC 107835 / XIL07) TaxID=446471 RepID=D1BXM4_XYLCX|nr:hypothetical protein [Xylanimonas cellulosilytica]ACZ29834.1 hypothetical protein Xcel_0796 [Xylanimonas cellulosilytica DSM 15894]